MATTIARGNLLLEEVLAVSLTPNNGSNIAANTSVETTYTLPGVQLNDFIEINKPSHTTGLVIGNVRVSAANQVAVMWANVTTAAITPTAETYLLAIARCEYQSIPSAMSA